MKEKAQRLVLDDEPVNTSSERCVKNKSLDCDEGYFNTYSHFAIHHEMLTVIIELYEIERLKRLKLFSNNF